MEPAAPLGIAGGAVAALAGAWMGMLASIRASQLAARAPLAPKLHALSTTVVHVMVAVGKPDYDRQVREFEIAWSDFIVHQKILAPSDAVTILAMIMRQAAHDKAVSPVQFVALAGEAIDVMTEIIALHSEYLFKWRARRAERRPIAKFEGRTVSTLKSPEIRALLNQF